MIWTVETLDDRVDVELDALQADMRAKFVWIAELIETKGLPNVREPYVKPLVDGLWEIRMKGRDGIARDLRNCQGTARRCVARVSKEDAEDTAPGDRNRAGTRKGGCMTQLKDLKSKWMADPEFRSEYKAQEDEFTLAAALIDARMMASMTQEQVADAMGTTQAAIARMESGKTPPSTRTLRRFAKATGTKLRISFERDDPDRRDRHAS